MKILVKWPTRSRPNHFFACLKRYDDYRSRETELFFVVTMDLDDETMNNPEVRGRLDGRSDMVYRYGNSKTKIEAVNADMDLAPPDWQILLLASDDMIPVEREFDAVIASDMRNYFHDLSGCLWYKDGRRRDLCTLSILGRKFYDAFGYIYHPAYQSLFCDNEFQAVATAMGKLAEIDHVIISHAWVDFTGTDALHRKNSSGAVTQRDQATFEARRAAGFPR